MSDYVDLAYKIRKYFAFSAEEIKSLVIAIAALSFIVGFDDGRATFETVPWLFNLFGCFLIVTLAILARETAHRIFALYTGHKVELKIWWMGLGFSLLLALVSLGKFTLLIYGGLVAQALPKHRLGVFRYGLSYNDIGISALMGSVANIALALIFKLFMFVPNPLIQKAIIINLLMACLNMLPIPPLDGAMLFFAERGIYIFATSAIIGASILIYASASIPLAIIGSLILGVVGAVAFNLYVENAK